MSCRGCLQGIERLLKSSQLWPLSLCIPLSLALSLKCPWHWCSHWVSCSGTTLSQAIQISFTFSVTLLYEEIEVGISFAFKKYNLIPSFTLIHQTSMWMCMWTKQAFLNRCLAGLLWIKLLCLYDENTKTITLYLTIQWEHRASAGKILC